MEKGTKFVRTMMMVCGAFAIFFTGFPHVWSIYQPYAMELTGWSQGQTSMCFYLAMATFVFGNIFGGRLQDKYSPRLAVSIGGGIFAAGILLSAFCMLPSPVMIYLTYGVMQGFGQGMIYTTIISTAQKWFPDRPGLASGIVVTANGLCGFFLAPLSRMLLAQVGISQTLLIVGVMVTVSWLLGWKFIKNPVSSVKSTAQSSGEKAHQYTSGEMVRTKKFYYLLSTMLFGLISYLILSPLSQTVQIERGISASIAVSAVMIGSVCNAGTRLILPTLADKIGRIGCIKAVLLVSVAAMALLIVGPAPLTTVCVILMYGCYGGIMGSFPSLTSSIFGIRHSGENYGFVMIGIVIATFAAPAITGVVNSAGLDVNVAFAAGAVSAVLSFLSLLLLEREIKAESGTEAGVNPC
ncbi:MFS transporter [Blautia schinkii]|nr:MFS transporter [Blautia schinkii]